MLNLLLNPKNKQILSVSTNKYGLLGGKIRLNFATNLSKALKMGIINKLLN